MLKRLRNRIRFRIGRIIARRAARRRGLKWLEGPIGLIGGFRATLRH